jgi:hypothetical protein
VRGGHTTFALVPRSAGDASSDNKEDAHVLNTSTTKLQHYKKEEAEWPAVLSVVVLYRTWKSQAGRPSFQWTTHDQPVAFHAVCGLPPVQLAVGMHIDAAVGPDTSPRRVVDEHHVCAQSKRHKPHPHGRNAAVMVTPKPKLIAAPTTIPGRGGKKPPADRRQARR